MAISDNAAALREIGLRDDAAIDLAEAALRLAALDRPRADLAPYRAHLAALVDEVGAAVREGEDGVAALRRVLVGRHRYGGDAETYDDLDNANLMAVIDRRRGLPVGLAIVWLHAARGQGWTAEGLNFPGHFLIRVAASGAEAILDPFGGGAALGEAELRALIRRVEGGAAELSPEHIAAVGNRALLLRLQNNMKLRLLKAGRVEDALVVLERMVLIAPGSPALWRECGLLHQQVGNMRSAIACLEQAGALAASTAARHRIGAELQAIRARLN